MRKIFVPLLLAMLLSACSSKSVEPTDPEKVIDVRAGKEFTIILESNPTTGYHWEIVPGTLDENRVQFVSRDYQSTSDPGLVGGGGLDIWTFKAAKPGEAKIMLGNYPPSNTPTDPQQIKTFNVSVK